MSITALIWYVLLCTYIFNDIDCDKGIFLAQHGSLQHPHRRRADIVSGTYYRRIANESGEKGRNINLLRCTITVSCSRPIILFHSLTSHSDVIATSVQTAFLSGFSSPNPTRDLWKWTLVTQIIECITILTSCVPYLRPLIESLPSGLYASDDHRRRGTPSELGYSRTKSGSYQLSSSQSHARPSHSEKRSQTRSKNRRSHNENGMKRFLPMLSQARTTHSNSASGLPGGPRRPDGETGVQISAGKRTSGDDKKWETESTGSYSKILKTTVVSAEWEEAERASTDMANDKIEVLR
jgi:hypothetical protein